MLLLKYISFAIAIFSCLHIFANMLIQNINDEQALDTFASPTSIFKTEPKYVLFSIQKIKKQKAPVIFLGASNVREGLRPQEMTFLNQRGYIVNNIALGASNMKQLNQLVRMSYKQISKEIRKDTIFVLGISYMQFVSDKMRWNNGITDIDAEIMRYGFDVKDFYGDFNSEMPFFAKIQQGISATSVLIKFYCEKLYDRKENAVQPVYPLTMKKRQEALAFWNKYMDNVNDWSEHAFQDFFDLCKFIVKNGSRIIVVDLPLPEWHKKSSMHDREYQKRLAVILLELSKLDGFMYTSMREGGFADNDDFYDSAHPWPNTTKKWATFIEKNFLH